MRCLSTRRLAVLSNRMPRDSCIRVTPRNTRVVSASNRCLTEFPGTSRKRIQSAGSGVRIRGRNSTHKVKPQYLGEDRLFEAVCDGAVDGHDGSGESDLHERRSQSGGRSTGSTICACTSCNRFIHYCNEHHSYISMRILTGRPEITGDKERLRSWTCIDGPP